jgi:hypothetical protein
VANVKTLIDDGRLDLYLDRTDVFEVMPGHYDELYPNLALFLKKYYETLDQDGNPANLLNELLTNRDVVSVRQEFLGFLSNELLLGKPYFEQFNDKRTALQFSNLLYRSKGTEYSIQQFFRIFYSVDVEVFYGRDFLFNIGDPIEEHLEYKTKGPESGSVFRYSFAGAPVAVYTREDDDSEWILMRQDIDYVQNFTEKAVEFLIRDQRDIEDNGYVGDKVADNEFYEYLAETGFLGFASEEEQTRVKLITTRSDTSVIGTSTQKRLTNAEFYQLFALMIQTEIGTEVWREAYKTFVHPSGMFLTNRVRINSKAKVRIRPRIEIPVPPIPPGIARVLSRKGRGKMSTSVTEIGPGPFGYRIRSRVNDLLRREFIHTSTGERLRIGSKLEPLAGKGWGNEYLTLHRANDINARRLDDTYITLSNQINTLDENIFTGQDSDGFGNPWLGNNDGSYPAPSRGYYLNTEGDLFLLTEDGYFIEV